jgi:DnaK suppressor protein
MVNIYSIVSVHKTASTFDTIFFSKCGQVGQERVMTKDFILLRQRLENERKRLLEELKAGSMIADRRERDSYSEGGECAAAIIEVEKGLVTEKHLQNQLADVSHALDKFDQGTYGVCDICGQPIAPAWLEALPQSSLCINCKSRQAKIRM